MLQGSPFPKLRAKAAETKSLLQPVAEALVHFEDQDPTKAELIKSMVTVLNASRDIDELLEVCDGYVLSPLQSDRLEALVFQVNMGTAKLCHVFHQQGLFLFNYVPKNHYLFHLAMLGKHMSPKLAWCYQGEDLMNKVKTLAQGSFRGTPSKHLGNKVIEKYLVALGLALSS